MFVAFWQLLTSSQFFLYGKKHCTKTGWDTASAEYPVPDLLSSPDLNISDRVFLITGANSGIGLGITTYLALKNATVYMVCRSLERAESKKLEILKQNSSAKIHILIGDCGLEKDVRRIWSDFCAHQSSINSDQNIRLDCLICNAGGLSNELTHTTEGVETTFATHLLFGTYLLTKLSLEVLRSTPQSRVLVVSSGGMYNTKFPRWEIATSQTEKYDGQMVYAYAKRGQVLLCEEWTKQFPELKFMSCHPGWVDTPGVDSAYGEKKSYLEPLRNIWEGSEGIIWLSVAPVELLQSGEFYLDRTPRVKHMSGPFFSEGSFTKNSESEIHEMMQNLELWSDAATRQLLNVEKSPSTSLSNQKLSPLGPLNRFVDIQRYMGKWYVAADIPIFLTKGTVNNVEEYRWDEARKLVLVSFKYSTLDSSGHVLPPKEVLQHGSIVNEFNSEWSLAVKFLIYWPIGINYLIIALEEDYSACIVGIPDRSMIWIMTRSYYPMSDEQLQKYLDKAAELGYDPSLIKRVPLYPEAFEEKEGKPSEENNNK